jgi:hypothetical protein
MQVDENLRLWQQYYNWVNAGDEWSTAWGGSENQWNWTVLPRIHKFVPCGTILEIAPGFGRWTQYLHHLCRRLEIVDLAPKCIDHCRDRFRGSPNIRYHVNDGLRLNMIADGSIDFAFSLDSLVHAEAEVIDSYVRELSRKLTRNGVGFLHHSNLAECKRDEALQTHVRASSVGAEGFRASCNRHGISCISQEIIDWGGHPSLDCLSTITREGSRWSRSTVILINDNYMSSAHLTKVVAALY